MDYGILTDKKEDQVSPAQEERQILPREWKCEISKYNERKIRRSVIS